MSQCGKLNPSTLRHTGSQTLDDVFATPSDPSSHDQKCSSATKLVFSSRAASTPPERTNDRHLRGRSQAEGAASSQVTGPSINWSRMTLSRQKSQYYDEAFAFRKANGTHKARAAKDFLIIAEVKLSCRVESEHEFYTDMAFLLSEIYQRSTACVMVLMNSNFSILLNTSTEPAYHITITAPALDIASTMNRRSAGLIQAFMLESTSLAASRGVIVFIPIMEGNVVAEATSIQSQAQADEGLMVNRTSPKLFDAPDGNKNRKILTTEYEIHKSTPDLPRRAATPSFWSDAISNSREARSTSIDNSDKKKVRRRKSFMALFGF